MKTFMDSIYGITIRGIGEDEMCWKPDQKKASRLVFIAEFLVIIFSLGKSFGD